MKPFKQDCGFTMLTSEGCTPDDYLHLMNVTIFTRLEEDGQIKRTQVYATTGDIIQGSPSKHIKTTFEKENPSARRQAVAIEFFCEGCDDYHMLHISEHKGQVYVNWRKD